MFKRSRNALGWRVRKGAIVAAAAAVVVAQLVGEVRAQTAGGSEAADKAAVDRQIADVEKQMRELNQRLAALRSRTPTPNPVAKTSLPAAWVEGMKWRSIGPAAMGGRITAISVFEKDPSTFYVATASGGLLATHNNGITFSHCFDREATVSIGDVCVAPSDRNIVWVGTGENNPRNSVSYGDGVYKSVDGGKTFKKMGLSKTYQTGKILIDPHDPNIVYVGALGRCYGPNEERGLYKTTDGGATWNRILYVDDKTGVIDMRMHPTDGKTILVATWERQRDEFDTFIGDQKLPDAMDRYDPVVRWGFGTAIYKTTDAGKSFKKITKGLPSCKMGRIGLDWYAKDPKVVYAIVDSEKIGMGPPPARPPQQLNAGLFGELVEGGMRIMFVMDGGPAEAAGLQEGDVILSVNDKPAGENESFTEFLDSIDVKVGDKVRVAFRRNERRDLVEMTVAARQAGPGFGQPPPLPATRPWLRTLGGQGENYQDKQGPDGHEYGGIYRSDDGGESWKRINSLNPRPMYFSQVRVDPSDNNFLYVLGVSLYRSKDGGKTFRADGGRGVHADHHAMWIDPRDGRHAILGCDGGAYVTYDRLQNWDHLNHLALGQFYHVCIDPRRPAKVYGGLQDNGSWGGPVHTLTSTGPINEDWIRVGGGDGFVCRVDPDDPDIVYSESQGGTLSRRNLRTGEVASIAPRRPQPPGEGTAGREGPAAAADQKNAPRRAAETAKAGKAERKGAETKAVPPAATSQAAPRRQPGYRFNWNTPFILSHHNSKIVYVVGEYVFRSLNRGDDWKIISPEITRLKIGSGTAIAESPRNPDILYAGTDDGALWATRDGGKTWEDVTRYVPLPGPRWVATLEASKFAEGRCYACFDGHRSDDDDPYVFVTEDFGKTWKSIRANLPYGSTRVLREDPNSENLLYVGTEFAAFASIDRGQSWQKLNNNLPTVAVHEFAFHPTTGEMAAATHGRSIWMLDVAPLRQANATSTAAGEFLFAPTTAVRMPTLPSRGGTNRRFVGQNAENGAAIYYALAKPAQNVSLKIVDVNGQTVREFRAVKTAGLHRAQWPLTRAAPTGGGTRGQRGAQSTAQRETSAPAEKKASFDLKSRPSRRPGKKSKDVAAKPAEKKDAEPTKAATPLAGARGGQGGGRGFARANFVPPGNYRVVLNVDGRELTRTLRVEYDAAIPPNMIPREGESEIDDADGP